MAVFLSPKFNRLYGTAREGAWRPRWEPIRDLFRLGWPGALMFGNEMVCWSIFMVAQVRRRSMNSGHSVRRPRAYASLHNR